MAGLILIGGVACASDRSDDSTGEGAQSAETAMPIIEEAPGFELTHQDGARVALADLRGSVVLMNFIYTSCPDVCQLQNLDLKRLRDRMDEDSRRQLVLVSVSFDPEVDTPTVLKDYARAMGGGVPEWYFLTGSQEEITRVTAEYGVFYQLAPEETHTHDDGETETHARSFNHMNQAVLIDQQGMLRRQYLGMPIGGLVFPVDNMVEDISALLDSQ
jgi:protein SCO1/2